MYRYVTGYIAGIMGTALLEGGLAYKSQVWEIAKWRPKRDVPAQASESQYDILILICLNHDKLIGLNISTKINNESFLFRTYI